MVSEAKARLPTNFDYTVMKYHASRASVSFIHSPDFDTAPEPIVGDLWVVYTNGIARQYRQAADPFIYHHKWLFVADDYTGFSVEASRARSLAWIVLPGIDRARIGRRSYWESNVLPHLSGSI
jgi:hypothetical protein